MDNSPGFTKDNSIGNENKKSNVPPLFGLEAIEDQKFERNRTPNLGYYSQNRMAEDDSIFAPRFIYSPTPIDKSANPYNINSSPSNISPSVFSQTRYTFSPTYNPSPASLLSQIETPSQPHSQSQTQVPPLSMLSLIDSTNNMELPKSEPMFTQPPPLHPLQNHTMPPPSSSPLFSYNTPTTTKTPKFDDLPPLGGDIYTSSLFTNNNNNNINGLSGLLSKTTLNGSFNNNHYNNDIPLYQSNNSPLFDINRFISSSLSSTLSNATTTTTTSITNSSNNHTTLFSNIQIPKQLSLPIPTSSSTNSLTSSLLSLSTSSKSSNSSNNSNDSFVPTDMDIINYEELMKELVMCQMCAQRLQKVKCFSYNDGYICCSCSGKITNRKTLGDWEIEEQNGVLCKRLNHHKNRVSYMKKQANGSFKIETLCIFCRNMKSYEYYRKQENKTLK